jgi:hypothetical protein
VCLLLRHRRAERASDVAATSGWLLLSMLVLLTGAVYGHYFVSVVAMAAVSGEASLHRTATWLSIGGLSAHAVGAIGWSLDPLWIGTLGYQMVGAAVLFGPAAVAALLGFLPRRTRPNLRLRKSASLTYG